MKRLAVLVILVLAVVVVGSAQSNNWDFSYAPRFWGASFALRYSVNPPAPDRVETSFLGGLSGAFESVGFYRAPDGTLFASPQAGFASDDTAYNRVNLRLRLGLMQGIVPRIDSNDDLAVFFACYRAQYDNPFYDASKLFFSSGLPEAGGSIIGSLTTGLAFSNVTTLPLTGGVSGIKAEAALEWGPSFLHNQILGAADFFRATLAIRGFVPLFALEPEGGMNRGSIYAAAFGAADWAVGEQIPLSVRSSIGGRAPRPAIGGAVRGYESGRFDATFKLVANGELRVNLPALFLPQLLPGVVLYTDAGYFLDTGAVSPDPNEKSLTVVSSGAGLFVDFFDAAQLIFYTHYLWNETTVGGESWVPFSVGFGFHF